MMRLFDAFKRYIVKHPREHAYKPMSDEYDREKLYGILRKLDLKNLECTEKEKEKVLDFLRISDISHDLYLLFYKTVGELLGDLHMKGEDIVEYFIGFLNLQHITVSTKIKETRKNMQNGTYMVQELTNQKMELQDGSKVEVKAAMEGATDATSMLCNYMRRHLDETYGSAETDPNRFAGTVMQLFQIADMMATFKQSYDNVLYRKSFVKVDMKACTIAFDDEDYRNEKLEALGQMIMAERVLHVRDLNREKGKKSALECYLKCYHVKRMKVKDGNVTLEFGQGAPKHHQEFLREMQAAIDAYYEYLDIEMKLEGLNGISLAEVLGVWVAIQYICFEITEQCKLKSRMIYTKEEMGDLPRKIKVADLEDYLAKLTGLKIGHVRLVLKALEVDWTKYNYIWTSPLYRIKDYYCVPFIPIVNSMPYNIIERMMQSGGYDLEQRGRDFERYVYEQIAGADREYEMTCIASKQYGSKKKGEEIDLLIGLRDIVVLVEAKCIHYSMEPQNYRDAWDRLEHGAEQAQRKKSYVEAHPEMFAELGDVSKKNIVPVVLTNYPTYAGFEHEGVYVIDAHTFLSYFVTGYMTMRMMAPVVDPIVAAKFFYNDEAEMSANFVGYLKNQPVKKTHMGRMMIEEIPLLPQMEPWKCTCKTAVYEGNSRFDLTNGIEVR